MTNPLSQYFRTAKLYTSLPTDCQFYEPDMVETAANGEVAVYPLTTIDQIMLKTPDAILNGEAMIKVFRSCVPGVKDVKNLVEPDINALLLAIKIASSGPTMEIDTVCPNCSTQHTFDINCSAILETAEKITEAPAIEMDGLVIHVRPYNFEQRNLQLLNEVDEARSLKIINDNTELDENKKLEELAHHINKMANRTFDIVAKSITSITITKTGETVTDQTHISEFLKGIGKAQADVIIDQIKQLNQSGIDTKTHFQCSSCNHEWEQNIDFDPTSFFD